MRLWSKWTYLCALLLLVAAISVLGYVVAMHLKDPSGTLSPLVIYISAVLALAGWMAQAWNAARISRKQHSMKVLFDSRMSAVHKDHSDRISQYFSGGAPLTIDALRADRDLHKSVLYLLNYYEFVAVAIREGDLDETIVRASIRGQLTSFVSRARSVISHFREEDDNGVPSPECALVYQHLLPLNARWVKFHTNFHERRFEKSVAARCMAGNWPSSSLGDHAETKAVLRSFLDTHRSAVA